MRDGLDLFAFLVILVVFVSTVMGTTVTVMTDPPNVSIYTGDRLLAQSVTGSATIDLPPGTYTLKFTSPGYASLEREITVSTTPITLSVELRALGWLEIDTTPTGVSILLKGLKMGKTPIEFEAPSGTVTLELKLDGYLDVSTSVYVEPFGKKRVGVSMVPVGMTIVETVPPGADLSVDGSPVGVTPLKTVLKPGTHEITLEKAGYFSLHDTVLVESSTITRYVKRLTPKATLVLNGLPQDAIITLDSTTTLKKAILTTPGKHRLIVEMPGYSSFEKVLELKPGRNELRIDLVPQLYRLVVDSTPSAIVQVDDLPYALTPSTFTVTPGIHSVTLFKVVDGSTSLVWKDRIVVATDTFVKADVWRLGTLEVVSRHAVSVSDGDREYPVPTIIHLPEGVWKFVAKLDDGSNFEFWVSSKPGRYQLIDLDEKLIAHISVVTPTPGATVSVDGKFVGHTPMMDFELLPGPHAVTVYFGDGTSAMRIVVVPVGENVLLAFK